MTGTVDRLLESHPDVAGVWYPATAVVAGRVLALPGLGRVRPLARRVHAVATPTDRVSVRAHPTRPPSPTSCGISVLSANLWHDWPRQHRWSRRLEAVARLIEGEAVDVVLLQEVARTTGSNADQWLADRLGMAVAYARANGSLDAVGFEEGLAVLSRFPIGDVQVRQLDRSRNPLVRRIALGVVVVSPAGPVVAVSAHLGLGRRGNARQLRELRRWVDGSAPEQVAIVGGDLNAVEHRSGIEDLRRGWVDTYRAVRPAGDAVTHTSNAPWRVLLGGRRLDYIFLRQPSTASWQVAAAEHLHDPAEPHSDHRAVLARLRAPSVASLG